MRVAARTHYPRSFSRRRGVAVNGVTNRTTLSDMQKNVVLLSQKEVSIEKVLKKT